MTKTINKPKARVAIQQEATIVYGLVNEQTYEEVCVGDVVHSFRDDEKDIAWTVTGGRAPHKAGSTGRVYVRRVGETGDEQFFPSVFGLAWARVG